jgi:AAA+ superfamily predicted ATPase
MDAQENWSEANKAYLLAAMAELKMRLQQHADPATPRAPVSVGAAQLDTGAAFQNRPPALETVARSFGLSPFERSLLLLCAGIELDAEFATLCAAAQGDPAHRHPTFSLALVALPEPHWSALAPDAPLRRWRIIELSSGPPLTMAPLRIDERVLHYLAGVAHLDERLGAMLDALPPTDTDMLVPSHRDLVRQIDSIWSVAASGRGVPVVQLCGVVSDCRPIAAAVAGMLGLRAASLPAELVPTGALELEAFMRLWEREAVLAGIGVLLVEWDEEGLVDGDAGRARTTAAIRLIERLKGLAIIGEREPRRIAHRPSIVLNVAHPLGEEQRQAWHDALRPALLSEAREPIDAVASQFSLSDAAIRAIAAEAIARAAGSPPRKQQILSAVWDLCRARLRRPLEGLAQRIESGVDWDDLVLPEPQKQTLRTIAVQLRQRATVYERWGFAQKTQRGLGVSALFWGQSGTGKTMAAEVLANEFRLDLYRIDLSSVVSKYIGETEKNLRRVFDAAEESGAILLFDEADALFGKRSEVKDSHDRYANIEVSYLLQRMEAYRGLAILTTNLKSTLDPAFLRRLRFVVEFPFPDQALRAEIWRGVFPSATPTEDINVGRLAQLRIAGGNIRNIAMNAAFLAADAGEPVRMTHLIAATRSEYAKLERPLTAAEIGGLE